MATPPANSGALDPAFIRRVLVVIGLILLAAVMVRLQTLLLLVFGAVVVAVLLRTMADPICRRTPLPGKAAVLLSLLVVLALVGLTSWLFGRQVAEQAVVLSETLPRAWARVQAGMEADMLGGRVLEYLQSASGQASQLFALAPKAAASLGSAVTMLLLMVVAGVMLAMNPRAYRDGLLLLFPSEARPRLASGLNATGRALRLWLLGQLVSMTVIGLLTGVGLWIVGVPSPLALGLIAGLAQFVPVVGPLVSAVPGLVIAASEGGEILLWTLAVYVGVQQVESNLITPFIQKRMVDIPMALTLFAVVGFGMLFGPLGVIFATPLAVALFVLVRLLYVRDVLGEDIGAPGQSADEPDVDVPLKKAPALKGGSGRSRRA